MPEPVRVGWWLSSEEHAPRAIVEHAACAERAGVVTAMISDHLQPWVRRQGHAGHVWTLVGAIAQATDGMEIGVGATAMIHRNHPINVAQSAATAALLLEERFFLGVGSGERLNEQAFARRWPRSGERRDRLAEAIEVIRALWRGDVVNHDGPHWHVENLALCDVPARPPPIRVAAGGRLSAQVAGRVGDGLIAVDPDARIVDYFRGAGGRGPCLAQLHVSLASTADEALEAAWTWWPTGVVPARMLSELAQPQDFEAIAEQTERDRIHDTVVTATDATPIVKAIDRYVGAGFDTVYLHQIGPDQRRLADLIAAELIPHYRSDLGDTPGT
jgi:coenzyme F420-dependent glucose-6-phosphate dehydrogenase